MDDIGEEAVKRIRRFALTGASTGRGITETAPGLAAAAPGEALYLKRCTHFHWRTGTVVRFTRDTGLHTCGWLKDPQFERCRHLSLSFRQPQRAFGPDQLGSRRFIPKLRAQAAPWLFDAALARLWVTLLHGEDRRFAWHEGPFTGEGRAGGVQHWRVFCDPGWTARANDSVSLIMPQGEAGGRGRDAAGWSPWVGAE